MITRSKGSTEFFEIPDKEQIIWISCSDFYHAYYNNYIHFVMKARFPQSQLNNNLFVDQKRKIVQTFYMDQYNKGKTCFYLDQNNVVLLKSLVQKKYDLIMRIGFSLNTIHVHGYVDGIIRVQQDAYALLFVVTTDKPSDYDIFKMHLSAFYFIRYWKKEFPYPFITNQIMVYYAKTGTLQSEIRHEKEFETQIRKMFFYIRKAKRYCNDIDLESPFLPPRYLPNIRVNEDSKETMQKKKELALHKKDISLLYYCGNRLRNFAFDRKIYSFDHPSFLNEAVYPIISSPDVVQIVKKMIRMNTSTNGDQWIDADLSVFESLPDHREVVFIDFEYDDRQRIYLVGVYHNTKYKSYWADSIPFDEEKIMADVHRDFPSHWFVYWHAEKTILAQKTHSFDTSRWIDLCQICKTAQLVMKQCFNYSLKSIVNAMHHYGIIPFCYEENENGFESLKWMQDYFYLKNNTKKQILEEYNQKDCESMYFIYRFCKNKLIA